MPDDYPSRPLPAPPWEDVTGNHQLRLEAGSYCNFSLTPTNSPHWHNYYEICLVLAGRGLYHHGGHSYPLEAGDLFVADPQVIHEITSHETRDLALVFLNAHLQSTSQESSSNSVDRCLESFLRGHVIHRSGQQHLQHFAEGIDQAAAQGAMQPYFATQQLYLLGLAMLTALAKDAPTPISPSPTVSHPTIQAALSWIDSHLDTPLTVTEIAAAVHCSPRTLRRLFQQHLGTRIIQVVHERKLTSACHLLMMRFPVWEVAERCGMESPTHFSRLFKQHFGLSPKAYQLRYAPHETVSQSHFQPG